jgi:hypothetical protein
MREMKNAHKILVDKREGNIPFRRTSHPASCPLGVGGYYTGGKAAGMLI